MYYSIFNYIKRIPLYAKTVFLCLQKIYTPLIFFASSTAVNIQSNSYLYKVFRANKYRQKVWGTNWRKYWCSCTRIMSLQNIVTGPIFKTVINQIFSMTCLMHNHWDHSIPLWVAATAENIATQTIWSII